LLTISTNPSSERKTSVRASVESANRIVVKQIDDEIDAVVERRQNRLQDVQVKRDSRSPRDKEAAKRDAVRQRQSPTSVTKASSRVTKRNE